MPRKFQKAVTQSLQQKTPSTKKVETITPKAPVTSVTVSPKAPLEKPVVQVQPPAAARELPSEPVAPIRSASDYPKTPVAVTAAAKPQTTIPKIVSQVMAVVAEESGIAEEELTDDSNFADMGVDSLCSMVIGSRMREDLHLDLAADFSVFVNCPTVRQLKEFLIELDGGVGPSEISNEEPIEIAAPMAPVEIAPIEDSVLVSAPSSPKNSSEPSSSASSSTRLEPEFSEPAKYDEDTQVPYFNPSVMSAVETKAPTTVVVEEKSR